MGPSASVPLSSHAASPRAGAERRNRAASPGRWILRVLLLLAIAWALVELVASLERTSRAQARAAVDARSSRVDLGPGWFDPRWKQELQRALQPLGSIDPEDAAALERARSQLRALPFVAEVGSVRVLWPDGLQLDFQWTEPVACIHSGSEYLPVSASGRVLPGRWRAPPGRGSGFLPVILLGPAPAAARTPREARSVRAAEPGATLREPSAADGLAVADSLWRHLSALDLSRMGRIVIDARRARAASLREPGTILWLENARRIDFGRSPNLDAPGELPAADKWRLVARGLALLDPGSGAAQGVDWSALDVRWDQGAIEPRAGALDGLGEPIDPGARGDSDVR